MAHYDPQRSGSQATFPSTEYRPTTGNCRQLEVWTELVAGRVLLDASTAHSLTRSSAQSYIQLVRRFTRYVEARIPEGRNLSIILGEDRGTWLESYMRLLAKEAAGLPRRSGPGQRFTKNRAILLGDFVPTMVERLLLNPACLTVITRVPLRVSDPWRSYPLVPQLNEWNTFHDSLVAKRGERGSARVTGLSPTQARYRKRIAKKYVHFIWDTYVANDGAKNPRYPSTIERLLKELTKDTPNRIHAFADHYRASLSKPSDKEVNAAASVIGHRFIPWLTQKRGIRGTKRVDLSGRFLPIQELWQVASRRTGVTGHRDYVSPATMTNYQLGVSRLWHSVARNVFNETPERTPLGREQRGLDALANGDLKMRDAPKQSVTMFLSQRPRLAALEYARALSASPLSDRAQRQYVHFASRFYDWMFAQGWTSCRGAEFAGEVRAAQNLLPKSQNGS